MDFISGTNIPSKGSFRKDCPIWCGVKVKYFGCGWCLTCCKKKRHADHGVDDFEDSDKECDKESEFVLPFNLLSTDEKQERVEYLWVQMFGKLKGAVSLIIKYKDLT